MELLDVSADRFQSLKPRKYALPPCLVCQAELGNGQSYRITQYNPSTTSIIETLPHRYSTRPPNFRPANGVQYADFNGAVGKTKNTLDRTKVRSRHPQVLRERAGGSQFGFL